METVFRILGPLEVSLDERLASLGGRRERAMLAVLLLNIGEVTSVERLIDGVWGEARPPSAKHMVHEYVSRLRQTLAEVASISTRPPGYVLQSAGGALDAQLFVQLTEAARAAIRDRNYTEALRSYDQALAFWRGDALADVALEGDAQIAVARLDHERRLVGEERVDCALALGQHLQLIPELERRVEQAPLLERPRGQLMVALYRAGRQIEALDRFREGRALLVEHAGVEPGPDLRELERAILTQDPALDPAPGQGRRAVSGARRRRWPHALVAGVLLAAVIAVSVLVVHGFSSGTALARIEASSAGAIDSDNNRLVQQVRVGTGPGRIAAGLGSLWVVNDFDSTVSRIDPATGTAETIQVDGDPTAIAVGAGFVWVACGATRSVDKIDPQLNRRVQHVRVGNGPSGIAISRGAVWVTNRLDDTVTEIDSTTGNVREHLNSGPSPSDVAYGFGALWIANESSSTVTRLDPRTGVGQPINVGSGPEAVAVGYGSVWVADSLDGTVYRIDPASNRVTSAITVGSGPSSVLASDGAIWVAKSYDGRVVRIDPATNGVVHTIIVGSGPQSLASLGDRIWVSTRAAASVHRGGTLRVSDPNYVDSLDTGVGYTSSAWSVFAATGDGLVGFRRVGGLDGNTLVPDLATSLPTPTDDGRTYAFQLRRGIRYSNGDPVRASDVRRALERDLRINQPDATFYGELVGGEVVGGDTCSRSRCDLSRGVIADDRAATVTLRLRKPDPELLYKLALSFAYPVPPEVSMTKAARLGAPGTGPYMVQSYENSRLVLVRSPRFRLWSAAAQPDGYPDRIALTYAGGDPHIADKQLTAVEHGRSDLMSGPPPSRLDEISTRYAAQVHVFPARGTFAIFLNTTLPPFNSLLARRAFNFAIDRRKAVAVFGGAEGAAATCQIVPAGMQGYRPYCPYTQNRTRDGVWSGPDLARAQQLVTASGTRGEKVLVRTSDRPGQKEAGRLAAATLRQLGYRVSLKVIGHDKYFNVIANSRNRAQAGFFGWFIDYPAASSVVMPVTCRALQQSSKNNVNYSEFCNRGVDQVADRALAQQSIAAQAESNATWAAVDRRVTDLAAWVPLVNPKSVVVVSRRVGNVQSNPQWSVLLDQIQVR